jgi:hypothetical protein
VFFGGKVGTLVLGLSCPFRRAQSARRFLA